jgi:AMP-binding enzyme
VAESFQTEASHQMTSNPLAPLPRKPGSVGMAAGPDVGIMDEAGRLLPTGEMGEVVIRGANVTARYEANPSANQAAFTNGWFRTHHGVEDLRPQSVNPDPQKPVRGESDPDAAAAGRPLDAVGRSARTPARRGDETERRGQK